MNELQALVTGMLMGALSKQDFVDVDLTPDVDDQGNYQPWFYVRGKNSGIRLIVRVEEAE